jgi:nicotinate phosphoribosyltransferase
MSFDTETEAFEVYAKAMPNNCVLLVDTYDTRKGVEHAIKIALTMKDSGNRLLGIRIDSGDLAYFSIMARKMLDNAGLTDVKVIASNDLDENLISSLKEQEAAIDIWGIGTKLVTAYDQPALGAVYKLAAIKKDDGEWENKVKLSAQSIKINIPGLQKVRRFSVKGAWIADMIYNELQQDKDEYQIIDPADPTRRKGIKAADYTAEELLVPVFVSGDCVYKSEDINTIRERHHSNVSGLHKSIRRFANPHNYPVGLEAGLYQDRMDLILKLKTTK